MSLGGRQDAMRGTVVLDSPTLVARAWRGTLTPETLDGSVTLRLGPDGEGRRATVAVESGDAGLQIAAIGEGRPGLFRPPYPEWYYRGHLVVFLNPGHDHATRWLYAVDDAGAVVREAAWIAPGEEPGDHPSRTLPEPPAAEGEFRRLGEGRFWARLFIPNSEGFWPAPPPALRQRPRAALHPRPPAPGRSPPHQRHQGREGEPPPLARRVGRPARRRPLLRPLGRA